ncbi:MAG: helix-turn-helix transcriptional regulator [Lachnospiraceae bacterium]|nr:helix-turn-helix transcriptional regulator [Lachnospiraceae bacterium]
MVEFGEQLRRAREEKGMTQQSLAEQLYVTRQSVSRWECGDRYPDLLTTKKISEILEVSLDDLLSGKEMEKVVERNPVIENKVANNIMIALYAAVVLSMMVPVFDQLIRITGTDNPIFSLLRFPNEQLLMIATVIKIICFIFGLVNALRGMFSPKRMGVVIVGDFIAMSISAFSCWPFLTSWHELFLGGIGWQTIVVILIPLIPNLIGAVAACCYFLFGKKQTIWPIMIILAGLFNILIAVMGKIQLLYRYSEAFTLNHSLSLVLTIIIYGLFIFQTVTLLIKRKKVKTSGNKENE